MASPSQELAPPWALWQPLERTGEGATSVVWRARHTHTGQTVALKVAKGASEAEAVAREASVLSRVARRWGPRLVDAGPGFIATEWIEGWPLEAWIEGSPLDPRSNVEDRPLVAAVVAHAVGRALAELHETGVHHGDVKPANVLLAARKPARGGANAASLRGATLIDLGLAGEGATVLGGTARYASPELRERGEGGPAADMWALGMLLAEILDPAFARAAEPRRFRAEAASGQAQQPARWADALLGQAPGGRPGAAWIAARAARWLDLAVDGEDEAIGRMERVRRAYLRERARDLVEGATVESPIDGLAREWLESALGWVEKLAPARSPVALSARTGGATGGRHAIVPLPAVRRARWLVALVGPSAASWPLAADARGEGELAARLVELARVRDPAGWTREDVVGAGDVPAARWTESPDTEPAERFARLMRELARPEVDAGALAAAEDAAQRGNVPEALALQLALALTRAGETGRAWAALAAVDGAEADAMRAEIARRRGETATARQAASRAATAGKASHAGAGRRLWRGWPGTRGTSTAPSGRSKVRGAPRRPRRARSSHGGAAPTTRARASSTTRCSSRVEAEPRARLEAARGLLDLARGDSAPRSRRSSARSSWRRAPAPSSRKPLI